MLFGEPHRAVGTGLQDTPKNKDKRMKKRNKYRDARWLKLRNKALERDDYTCQNCGSDYSPEVHHKHYRGNIWDSPLDDLQTLCPDCHGDLGKHPHGGIWWEDGSIRTGLYVTFTDPQTWKPSGFQGTGTPAERDWFRVGGRLPEPIPYFVRLASAVSTAGSVLVVEVAGDAAVAYLRHPETFGLINEELRKTGRWECYRVTVPVPVLPVWDREALEALVAAPDRAAEWIHHNAVARGDYIGLQVTQDILGNARRCLAEGVTPTPDALVERATGEPQAAVLAEVLRTVRERDYLTEGDRIDYILTVCERRDAEVEARARLASIKVNPLSCDDEAEILEQLLSTRRAARGMTEPGPQPGA